MSGDELINDGMILRPGQDGAREHVDKTFIVTGIPRGGTTMAMGLLREAGVYVGEDVLERTHEDRDFIHALHDGDFAAVGALILRRNARGGHWAFKAPILPMFMKPPDLARFRNLHVIAVFRDPIAIGVRQALAEHESPLHTARNAARAMSELIAFMEQTACPTLMLSYEKCIVYPEAVIDTFMSFCGFGTDADLRRRLLEKVRPNDQEYVANVRRIFNGNVDGLTGTSLNGWCWDQVSHESFSLDVCFDGKKVTSVTADRFRRDVLDAGIGSGHYGFQVDLAPFGARPDTVVTVNISRKTYALPNSGKPLRLYPGFDPARFPASPIA